MKKIVFLLPDLEGGGAERVALNIIEQLDKDIFEVYLIVGNKRGDLIDMLPQNINVIDLEVKKTLFSFLPFYKQCRRIQPDLIYSTLNRTNIIAIITSLLLKNTKVIIREPNMPSNQIGLLPKSTLFAVKLFYPKADNVIAQTEEMKKEMIEYYNIDPRRINVLVNPININLIETLISNESNPFQKNQINIVAVGSFIYRKGFDVLINSFQDVADSFSNANLYILGKGIEEENLREQTNIAHLSEQVHFLGFQENPYKYLKYADMFVLSSRAEGLPNVVLESLYLKTKVVVTDCVPFISNLIKDNNLGEVVKIDNVKELSDKIKIAISRNDYNTIDKFNSSDFNSHFKGVINEH